MLFDDELGGSSSSDTEEHEEKLEKRRKKARSKRKIPKLKNEIVIVPNIDKDGAWVESWKVPKNRSPGHLPHPFRLVALGGVGRGKTNSCKNIILQHQMNSKKFKKVFIVTCDCESREWNDVEPEWVRDTLPDPAMFTGNEKQILVIDDFEFTSNKKEQQKRLSTIMRFCSSHRNLSVIISYQSFFHVPSVARKCANTFLIYKPTPNNEISTIANRVGIDKDRLHDLFENKCSGVYDSIMVDLSVNSPYPLRKNIFEPLDQDESDSD
jgi:hypothetical protein